MALPEFCNGTLPPGIHRAFEEEILSRFCSTTPERQRLAPPLKELTYIAQDASAMALYLNGSFVTDKAGPRDIDAVIELPLQFDPNGPVVDRLRTLHRDYGLDIEHVGAHDAEYRDQLLNEFFGTDRAGRKRGTVEVIV